MQSLTSWFESNMALWGRKSRCRTQDLPGNSAKSRLDGGGGVAGPLSFSGPTFPRRLLIWAGLRGASKPPLLLWKNDPPLSHPGCLEINHYRCKRLGTALFSIFQIHPPLEPAFSFIKFIVQLAFFIEYHENLYTEGFISWATNKTAPAPSHEVAGDRLGCLRGGRETCLVGRMTPSAREERKEVGQEEVENQLPSSVINRASARSCLVAQTLRLTENIYEVRSPVI